MKRTWIGVLVAALALGTGLATAETTTPLVPNDVGHWLNLEQRSGTLATEIATNPQLIRTILVVERSLVKVDTFLSKNRQTSGCHQLLLPYTLVTLEQIPHVNAQGDPVLSIQKVQHQENLPVGVCSTVEQRVVYWELDGSVLFLSRPRNEAGGFPRTLYTLFWLSPDERVRWLQRKDRLAARGKDAKPPKIEMLYAPPGDDVVVRMDHDAVSFFGAEFGLPPVTAGHGASGHSLPGDEPWEPTRPDR